MNADASADARGDSTGSSPTDYEAMLDTLDVAIEKCQYKIENGRIRDPEREKVRAKQWRTLGYLINIRRQVANDRDLEELSERVEALENGDTPTLTEALRK